MSHDMLSKCIESLYAEYSSQGSPIIPKLLGVVESTLLRLALSDCKYNKSRAARKLGISIGTLQSKLRFYFNDEFINKKEKLSEE